MSVPQQGRAALITGGLAALLASTCCLGPLVLVAFGFSGAWIGNLTALEPYRPVAALTRATTDAGYPSTPVKGAAK
jgi:mercuric ion transport protein